MKPTTTPARATALALLATALLTCLLAPGLAEAQVYTNKNETVGGFIEFGIHKYDPFTGALQSGFNAQSGLGSGILSLSGNTLYVLGLSGSAVGTYNATTGATQNSFFATAPAGWSGGQDTMSVSGSNLFLGGNVAAGPTISDVVAKYDATTGALTNASFITLPTSGFSPPQLAATGNSLFVTTSGTVGSYNATTGAPINGSLVTGLSTNTSTVSTFIADLTVAGSSLFVATQTYNIVGSTSTAAGFKIGKYDATTGLATNASLITLGGTTTISDTALLGNRLYVDYFDGTNQQLAVYDATTGASITPSLIAAPGNAIAIGPVPEPGSGTLALLGSLAFLARRRRRQGHGCNAGA